MENKLLVDYIPEEELARQRMCTIRTLQKERAMRKGPPFVRLGRKVLYNIQGFHEWLKTQEVIQPCATSKPRSRY